MKWSGWPLVLAGAIAVMNALGLLFFWDLLPQVMIKSVGAKESDLGPLIGMVSVAAPLFSEVGRNLLEQGEWMVIMGGGALVASRVLTRRGVKD